MLKTNIARSRSLDFFSFTWWSGEHSDIYY